MTFTLEAGRKKADVELANARIELARAQEGRNKLNTLMEKRQAEHEAALQDWTNDRSEKAVNRMVTARAQLNAVRELIAEDAVTYTHAAAELDRCERQSAEIEVMEQVIGLAGALSRQQEYFSDDVRELQSTIVELIDKLRKTADAWDSLHLKQYDLAREAGLSAEQLQRRVESWGYDANPLKLVLTTNALPSQREFKFPDAADGSDLAQYAKQVIIQGVAAHYNKQRSNAERERREELAPRRGVEVKSYFTAQDELEEAREISRRVRKQQELEAQRQREAEALEEEQDWEYGARPHVAAPSMTYVATPTQGDNFPAAASDGMEDDNE